MPDMWMDVDAALSEVPISKMPLIDDTDFKTREESVTYDQSGLDLVWNFETTAGVLTQTAVTPTDTAGDYDWVNQGNGAYTIEIPASGGASINNDTEGFGYFSGFATGILPWIGPIIGFRAAGLNNLLVDDAFSATRGLTGTALPAVAADGAGGLPISDAGGLDLDTQLAATNEVTAVRMAALTDWINGGRLDLLLDAIKAVTDLLPDGGALSNLDAAISSRSSHSATNVRTEMDSNSTSLIALLEGLFLQVTTIATLTSQTSFTLTAGSSDNDAYNGATIVVVDASTGTQKAFGSLSDYIGSSKTVTLAQDPGIFTMAATDKVYILPSDVFAIWDRVLTGNSHNLTDSAAQRLRNLQERGGYGGGFVYLDTVNGSAGTTDFENGTEYNPVDNMADLNTLLASLGLARVDVAVGSTVNLAAAQNNQIFRGHNWTLNLGGQDIAGSHFFGAIVSGTGIGATNVDFHDCRIGTVTLNQFHMVDCGYDGTVTFGLAGDYVVNRGHSAIAGETTPIFDTGAAIANVDLAIPGWENGIEIRNLNNAGTDLFSISGRGQIVYAASCSGTVNQRGNWKETNTGGVTIVRDNNAQTAVDWIDAGRLDLLLDAVKAVTDLIPDGGSMSDLAAILTDTNTTIPALIDALQDISSADVLAQVITGLNTAATESYAAKGVEPSVVQMNYWIMQLLTELSITGTTETIKKLDGSTVAGTNTLNSATDPTERTRAT